MDESTVLGLEGDKGVDSNDNLVFVDDHWLVGETMEDLVHRVRQCIRGTLSKGGAVHPRKLDFFQFREEGGVRKLEEVEVPFFGVTTSVKQEPTVVGIPVHGDSPPKEYFWKLAWVIRSLKARVMTEGANVALSLRLTMLELESG